MSSNERLDMQILPINELIDEIAMGPFGSNIKTDCFVNSGIPVINGSNLSGFSLNDQHLRFVTPEKANSLGKALASRGDIVVTHRGTLGQIAYIPENSEYKGYIISQSQFRFRCNAKVLPQYLVYYFHTPIGQWKLLSNKTQTGVPALGRPTSTFVKIEVEVPPLDRQKQIIEIIDSLQRKIELNAHINDYLEELALTLFQKELNFPPDCLPEGWKLKTLSDFMPIKTGKMDANIAYKNGEYPFFTCAQDVSRCDRYSFDGSAIIVAGNGNFNVKWYEGMFEAYQRTYVLMLDEPLFLGWLYCAVKTNLKDIVSGARGSVINFLTKNNLADCQIVVPPKPNEHNTIRQLYRILKTIDVMKNEITQLANLRDALLPKLMSGEIDVSKVDITQLNNHLCES